jgi:hypothetical protein
LEVSALSSCRGFGWAVVASTILAPAAPARADEGGGLVGWVESTRGVPVAGALVSVFGRGIRGGSLVTLADSQGQFVLPSLPPGSYTLRAVGSGHQPSAARHVTVLPNRDALYTLSLAPVAGALAAEAEKAASRDEWRWLVRHKRRSVLESAGPDTAAAGDAAPALALADTSSLALDGFDGSVELAATSAAGGVPDAGGLGMPAGMGSLQLQGRLTEGVSWALGGLVSESEGRDWRVAAEFVLEPGAGHEVEVGAGYGAGLERATQSLGLGPNEPQRAHGAVFARDRFRIGERLTTTAGARYTYLGFLPDSHHVDAVVEVEVAGDVETVVRGSLATRTLAPGGDLLTLSTIAASPAITWARLDGDVRAARSFHYEVGVDRRLGPAARLGARLFSESTSDALLTAFEDGVPVVRNGGTLEARGFGVTVGRRFGGVLDGSVTYTFGQGRRSGAEAFAHRTPAAAFEESEFHDLAARVETFIDWSDTRVAALCRLNTLTDAGVPSLSGPRASSTSTRFDVQLTQGLPFLAPLTRADWELLLAVRNMFYEASQAGFLDELAVQDPPTRVVGGISVRF